MGIDSSAEMSNKRVAQSDLDLAALLECMEREDRRTRLWLRIVAPLLFLVGWAVSVWAANFSVDTYFALGKLFDPPQHLAITRYVREVSLQWEFRLYAAVIMSAAGGALAMGFVGRSGSTRSAVMQLIRDRLVARNSN